MEDMDVMTKRLPTAKQIEEWFKEYGALRITSHIEKYEMHRVRKLCTRRGKPTMLYATTCLFPTEIKPTTTSCFCEPGMTVAQLWRAMLTFNRCTARPMQLTEVRTCRGRLLWHR